ncbi:MAG: hypothetical protein UY48_C0003G0073 [Candidatus Gottesmanbacteria bacterium GW2011_GWB1_49_7]|uniref:Uncharacterized protein n=1 Tax=Candidatus Gottesmanbacteria bacterium GW2011_GWB1_49_7 TaxID=1618448 RepID=A0A0G1W3B8_9BACT|nr:MAG: hypothetical protein UY48_C0003G0073 [Candidatus Gottesmanbacteria bacterium GW2011_GWB1_49_7]
MYIGHLSISFKHESEKNRPKDLGLDIIKSEKIIRGLGTHFINADSASVVKDRQAEDARIRKEFRERFVSGPIPGTFILNRSGDGTKLLSELATREDVRVTVTEFVIESEVPVDVADWVDRIKNQLGRLPLGRAKDLSMRGLEMLDNLANCPVLAKETREALQELIGGAQLQQIDRLEVQRRVSTLDVKIDMGQVVRRKIQLSGPEIQTAGITPRRGVMV